MFIRFRWWWIAFPEFHALTWTWRELKALGYLTKRLVEFMTTMMGPVQKDKKCERAHEAAGNVDVGR
jgi:hypothetical protein